MIKNKISCKLKIYWPLIYQNKSDFHKNRNSLKRKKYYKNPDFQKAFIEDRILPAKLLTQIRAHGDHVKN